MNKIANDTRYKEPKMFNSTMLWATTICYNVCCIAAKEDNNLIDDKISVAATSPTPSFLKYR